MSVVQLSLVALWFSLGAAAWFTYFRLKERASASPFSRNVMALLGGMSSVFLALFGYGQLEAMNVTLEWSTLQGPWKDAMVGALQLGAVEEGAKLLFLIVVIALQRGVKQDTDAMRLATYIGVGFAATEGMVLWLEGNIDVQQCLTRGLTAPLTHALFAAPLGLGVGAFVTRRQGLRLFAGILVSVASHGAYDLLLARPGSVPAFSALIVLALWTWVLVKWPYPHKQRDHRALPLPYELAEAQVPTA